MTATEMQNVPESVQEIIKDLEADKADLVKQLGPHAKLVEQLDAVNDKLQEMYHIVKLLQPRKRTRRTKAEIEADEADEADEEEEAE